MTTTKKPNKTTARESDQKFIAGVAKYYANVGKLTLAGTDYTPASLTAVLQAEIDALVALDSGKAVYMQQVATTDIARAKARAVRAALRKYILSTSGVGAVQMLEDFGIPMPKNLGPKTVEAKAQAKAKAKATRKAREEAIAKIAPVTAAPPAPNGVGQVSATPSK